MEANYRVYYQNRRSFTEHCIYVRAENLMAAIEEANNTLISDGESLADLELYKVELIEGEEIEE